MNANAIRYQVRPADPAGHRFSVRLTIEQPDPAGQVLRLPAWVPGSYLIRDFARHIETLHAQADGQPLACEKVDDASWRCAPCGGPLVVEYVVYAWDFSVRGAHVDRHHAFFNGASLFLAAVGQEAQPCLLSLLPPPHTADWRVYTSLPRAEGEPDAAPEHGFGSYRAPDYDALLDYPVEMGTPQCVTFEAHGARHEVVFTGHMPNLDLARLAADLRALCEAQIALFEPHTRRAAFLDSTTHYTFLVQITDAGYGGLEHRASSALMTRRSDLPVVGKAPGDAYQRFLGLASHEYFHNWNVKRIKPAAFAPYDLTRPNHTRLLWVFEGFTSYYDDLMLLRAGLIDEPQYFKLLARNFDQVRRGAGRHKQSLSESSFDAWTRYYKQDENAVNAIVSYYSKGALLALALDLILRQRTQGARGLDEVMRTLWRLHGRDFYRGHATGVPEDAMPAIVREATGVDVSDVLAQWVDGHADLPLDALLQQAGIALDREAPGTEPSLDAHVQDSAEGLRIEAVLDGGAAWQAGLAAGDLVVAVDGLRATSRSLLTQRLKAHRPGEVVQVHTFRRGELHESTLTLGEPQPGTHTLQRIDTGAQPA